MLTVTRQLDVGPSVRQLTESKKYGLKVEIQGSFEISVKISLDLPCGDQTVRKIPKDKLPSFACP